MTSKWRLLASTVFSLICLTSPARSDVLNIQGQTSGSYSPLLSALTGLKFNNGSFNVTTDATTSSALNIDLGSFDYTFLYQNGQLPDFTSTIKILVPTTNPGSATQEADVTAHITSLIGGSVTINFSNAPLVFNFSGDQGSGTFDLTLKDVAVTDKLFGGAGSATLYGDITNAHITGAAVSMAEGPPAELLLSLFVGVGYVLKKRMAYAV